MSLMYQEVCYTNITNGIIKGMKIELKNKWRKAETVNLDTSLDTSIYRDFIKNSRYKFDLSRSTILEFSDLNFGPWWLGLLGFYSLNL